MIVVLELIVPIILVVGLYIAKKYNRLSIYEHKFFWTNVFIYFYIDYNNEAYFWEFIKIFKRICLIFILIIFIDNLFVQIGFFIILMIVYSIILQVR